MAEVAVKQNVVPKKRKVRVVKTRTRKKSRTGIRVRSVFRLTFFCAVVIASLSLLIGILMGYNRMAMMQRETASLTKDLALLEAEKDHLRITLEPYLDKERIEGLAKSQLGMSYPTRDQIAVLPDQNSPRTTNVADLLTPLESLEQMNRQ